MISLSHILRESNTFDCKESIVIDDMEVLKALEEYMEGRNLRNQAQLMIDEAREILDRKLFNNGVLKSESNDHIIHITEYETNQLNSKALKEDYPDLYEKYCITKTTHRYKISKKIV